MIPKLSGKIKCQAMYLFGPQVNKQNRISRWKPLGHSSLHQGWRWVPRLPPVSTEKSLAQWEKPSPPTPGTALAACTFVLARHAGTSQWAAVPALLRET